MPEDIQEDFVGLAEVVDHLVQQGQEYKSCGEITPKEHRCQPLQGIQSPKDAFNYDRSVVGRDSYSYIIRGRLKWLEERRGRYLAHLQLICCGQAWASEELINALNSQMNSVHSVWIRPDWIQEGSSARSIVFLAKDGRCRCMRSPNIRMSSFGGLISLKMLLIRIKRLFMKFKPLLVEIVVNHLLLKGWAWELRELQEIDEGISRWTIFSIGSRDRWSRRRRRWCARCWTRLVPRRKTLNEKHIQESAEIPDWANLVSFPLLDEGAPREIIDFSRACNEILLYAIVEIGGAEQPVCQFNPLILVCLAECITASHGWCKSCQRLRRTHCGIPNLKRIKVASISVIWIP